MDLPSALNHASQRMGIQGLKPKQLEAIEAFVSGKDTFVSLPTGYGKSIIFAMLPLLFDFLFGAQGSIAVVVTPLISLMIDQKGKFLQRGLKVEFVGEAQTDENATMDVLNGDVQLVYISPESLLLNRRYRNMLTTPTYQQKLKALVVDEAHCVKFW
ncbi:ATP-dependent DNA helicase RecQ-like [Dysidea avara]|uniref:ATP-dependent DNA helicase RecQ-like n=1 Tax=Dysidea avara TaxID=196820 RepID=UPI00331987AB